MGNCCGGLFRSGSTGGSQSFQSNSLSKQRSRREHNWAATGQIVLRDSNIKELPANTRTIGSAAKLLDASNNKLISLSPGLEPLINLQRLNLANNALTSLYDVTKLQKLKVLIVDRNRLTELPTELGSLVKLERLQCSHNLLTSLPKSLGRLPSLAYLDCSSNKIDALPAELAEAAALESLDASDNYLRGVPEAYGQLKRLRTLILNKNQVTGIPSAVLKDCQSLQTLHVHQNPITAQELQSLDGYEDFERRRRSKIDKQILGGAEYNLDEGVDRDTTH